MPKHKLLRIVLPTVALGLFPINALHAQFEDGPQHHHIMDRKLAVTQEVMEGIARNDFKKISQQSQKLHLLSREAGWRVLATPTYLRLSEDFRATATQLEKAADKENLDAVGLAFVKLSISCIECHRYAREEMPRVGVLQNPKQRQAIVRQLAVTPNSQAEATGP